MNLSSDSNASMELEKQQYKTNKILVGFSEVNLQ